MLGNDSLVLNAVCERLRSNSARDLTILNLNFSGIGNRGAQVLADALIVASSTSSSTSNNNNNNNNNSNNPVVILMLDGNDITVSGACALAASFQHPNFGSLRQVFLSYNSIGTNGAIALAAALVDNYNNHHYHGSRRLQVLKLSHNKIGSSGAIALGQALRKNHSLQTLVLESNPIGVEGAIALAEGLKENNTLTTLNLNDCCCCCFNYEDSHNNNDSNNNNESTTSEEVWVLELCRVQQAFLECLETANQSLTHLVLMPQNQHQHQRSCDDCKGIISLLGNWDDHENNGSHQHRRQQQEQARQLLFYLQLNKLGRGNWNSSTIPVQAWPRLLEAATLIDNRCCCCCRRPRGRCHDPNQNRKQQDEQEQQPRSSSAIMAAIPPPKLLYAVVSARPDLLFPDPCLNRRKISTV